MPEPAKYSEAAEAILKRRFPMWIPEGYQPVLQANCQRLGIEPLFQPNPDMLARSACSIRTIVDLVFQEQRFSFVNRDDVTKVIQLLDNYIDELTRFCPILLTSDEFTIRAIRTRELLAKQVIRQQARAGKPSPGSTLGQPPSITQLLKL